MYLPTQRKLTLEVDAMEHHSGQSTVAVQLGSGVRDEDDALLRKIADGLGLLADVSHADLLLYVKSGDHVLVAAQARPTPVPPLYPASLVGQSFTRQSAPIIHRALFTGKMVRGFKGQMVRGSPTIQDTYPIRNSQGELIAVLSYEMNLLEFERRRKKNPVFKAAVVRLRRQILGAHLEDACVLSRLGEHNAKLVIDGGARILYASTLAEQLYRKLGYTTNLVGRRLSELDTSEHICFKAIERGRCLEQRIEEHNLVWLKRAVPLAPESRGSFFGRFLRRSERVGSALVLIEDLTEEHRKEQALRVKSALIREIHHRVKNNLQTIAALLRMQARRTGSPEVLDMLKQSINRILSIALVHEFLSKEEASQGEAGLISIKEVTQRMLSEVTQGILDPGKNIRITFDGADVNLAPQQATCIALVINELLQNAVEHGFESKSDGSIQVILRDEDGRVVVEVNDDGQGLPHDFDVEKDGSLGLQIVQTLVREDLKGEFGLSNTDGVHARVAFPKQNGIEAHTSAG